MVENIGRARPQAHGLAISQGAFLTPDQKRLAHDVMSDPRLAAALVYLEHNGEFARGIRLDVNACWGFDRAGTHWDIVNRSLSLCFVQLDAFHDRLKRDNDEDPRAPMHLLSTVSIEPWLVLLGGFRAGART